MGLAHDLLTAITIIIVAALCIPIVAIVGGIGQSLIKGILQHNERKMQIKAQMSGQKGAPGLRAEIEALREEMMRLRDTTTQYDVSIQHTLEELDRRVAHLEVRQRNAGPAGSSGAEPEAAILSRRG